MFLARETPKLRKRSLVQNDQPVSMSRQRRVEQFTREQPTCVRQNDECHSEFTALSLVHGQRVGELQRVVGIITKLILPKAKLEPELPDELDFQLPRQTLEILCLVLTHDHAEVAIGEGARRDAEVSARQARRLHFVLVADRPRSGSGDRRVERSGAGAASCDWGA